MGKRTRTGPTSKSAWQNFEREVAAADWDSKRNPLSGANNRQDDGTPRGGDVIIPADGDVLIECKYRVRHAHHTLYDDAKVDAKKHGKQHALLYTKVKRDHGWLVVIDGKLWTTILNIPGVRNLFKKGCE